YRVLLRPAYGSDSDLAEQPSPPLRRPPPADDGPPRPPRNPAVDDRGIRLQSPRGPALPLRELLVRDGPPPPGRRGSGRGTDANGPAPDALRAGPSRTGVPVTVASQGGIVHQAGRGRTSRRDAARLAPRHQPLAPGTLQHLPPSLVPSCVPSGSKGECADHDAPGS